MKADILISIYLLKPNEGGRKTDIEGDIFKCPIFVNQTGFDCRLILHGKKMILGTNHTLPAAFLDRDSALSKIKTGTKISLWEGKTIGYGEVLEIYGQQPQQFLIPV